METWCPSLACVRSNSTQEMPTRIDALLCFTLAEEGPCSFFCCVPTGLPTCPYWLSSRTHGHDRLTHLLTVDLVLINPSAAAKKHPTTKPQFVNLVTKKYAGCDKGTAVELIALF